MLRVVPNDLETQVLTTTYSESESKVESKNESNASKTVYHAKTITLEDFQRVNMKKLSVVSEGNYKYLPIWRRAMFRIKVRKVLSVVNEDIIKFGTSGDFLDVTGKFKLNLDEILWKKQNKREDFRSRADTLGDFLPTTLLNPDSTFMKIWSFILSVILLYTASVMPIRVAFYDVVFFDAWTIIDIMIDSLFFFDILVNCVATYERTDGTLEKNPTTVLIRYMRSWMIFDVIACLPFSFIEYGRPPDDNSNAGSTRYNTLVRLMRVPRLYKLLRIIRIAKAFKNYREKSFISQLQDYLRLNSSNA